MYARDVFVCERHISTYVCERHISTYVSETHISTYVCERHITINSHCYSSYISTLTEIRYIKLLKLRCIENNMHKIRYIKINMFKLRYNLLFKIQLAAMRILGYNNINLLSLE
jgi:hypothetical protein